MKKITSICLVCFMTFLCMFGFTACQQSDTNVDTAAEVTYKGSLPPVKLIWYPLVPSKADREIVLKEVHDYILKKINADVDIRPLDFSNYDTKATLINAAGDNYDILWVNDFLGRASYNAFVNRGYLKDISKLLDKYAPKSKALFSSEYWDLTKRKGTGIYGIPNKQIFGVGTSIWIRKDLADKYGFDLTNFKNYKQMEPFFDKILANEKGVTPFAAERETWIWQFGHDVGPGNGIEYFQASNSAYYVTENQPSKLLTIYNDKGLKADRDAKIDAAYDWMHKKYVKNDLLVVNNITDEIKAGKYAAGLYNYVPDAEGEFKANFGFDAYQVPLKKQVYIRSAVATINCISSTSTNPERSLMLLDLLNSDKDLYRLIVSGIEGKNYKKVNEDRIEVIPNGGYDQSATDWLFGNKFNGYLVQGRSDDYFQKIEEANNKMKIKPITSFVYDDSITRIETAPASQTYNEIGRPLLAGMVDPKTTLEDYDKKMKKYYDIQFPDLLKQFNEYCKINNIK